MAFNPPSGPPHPGAPPNMSREPRASDQIPPLVNIAPSMFVPLRDDFLKKHMEPVPRDRVEMLKRILDSIDFQEAGVKENLMWMLEREKQRFILIATERQADAPVDPSISLDHRQADRMIASMEAPAIPGVDYNVLDHAFPLFEPNPNKSIHDVLIDDLLSLGEQLTQQLEGYDSHITGVRKKFHDCLEKELMRINEAGLRPEERG